MNGYKIQALQSAPRIVERILRVFPHDRLDDRIDADRYTAREVVAHLADFEQTILDRIRVAHHTPGREVPTYDPDAQALQHHFGDKEVFHEAEVFESRRGMTLDFIHGLTKEDMAKTFVRDGETFTIESYLDLTIAHDIQHLEQISSYLATEVATIS
jgi:uncharacterized damage-inducible protein DinB